jgi:hypothetical protein
MQILTPSSLEVSLYITRFNIKKLYILPTHYVYVFYTDLRTNSDYSSTQHWLFGCHNRDGVCLLQGYEFNL